MARKLGLAIVLVLTLGLCAEAGAQENNACGLFKWSIARERGWFANAEPAASGATVAIERGYAVAMRATDAVAFPLPPERAPKPGSLAATLLVANIDKPGLYQVTLSDEAWLDVVQGDALVKSTGFSGQKDCPGVRKTVRFDLKQGPATLQISNSAAQTLDVAVAPAQ